MTIYCTESIFSNSNLYIISISYRVVSDEQRHLALGLQSAIYRTFGAVPGPLLFGTIIDLTCIKWQYECGRRGNCWIYNNNKLGFSGLALTLPCATLTFILFFFSWLTYPKKQKQQDIKEKQELTKM